MGHDSKKQAGTVQPTAVTRQPTPSDAIILHSLGREVRYVAGADVSLSQHSNVLYAGFSVMSWPGLIPVDEAVVQLVTKAPAVPGTLSLQEIPALLEAWDLLKIKPDIVVVDGVGIPASRRLEIASHLGLVLDVPTIGCAKDILAGVGEAPAAARGSRSPFTDDKTGEVIGMAVRTKSRANPVYISPGHQITLADSVTLVEASLRGYRLPEQTRLSQNLINAFKQKAADYDSAQGEG